MSGGVRALGGIGEGSWEATVDAAAALLPPGAHERLRVERDVQQLDLGAAGC